MEIKEKVDNFMQELVDKAEKLEKLAGEMRMGLWSKEESERALEEISQSAKNKKCECGGEMTMRIFISGVYFKCSKCGYLGM